MSSDEWYEQKADDLAGAESEFHSALGRLIDAVDQVDASRKDLEEAVAPLGRYSSRFREDLEALAREAWHKALEYDGMTRETLVVKFYSTNPWRRVYDQILEVSKTIGIEIKPLP